MEDLTCIVCSEKLVGKRTQFCSRECKNRNRHENNEKNPEIKFEKCINCNKKLIGAQIKFCSEECRYKNYYNDNKEKIVERTINWNKNNPEKRKKIQKTYDEKNRKTKEARFCIVCDKELIRNQTKYCSKKCKSENYYKNNRKIKETMFCVVCEKELIGRQTKFCSNKCSRKNFHKNNKEKENKTNKIYRENNKEKIREKNKKYRENNLEKEKERQRRYRKNNPEKVKECERESRRKRRERKIKADEHYTKKDEQITLELFNYQCFNCGSEERLEIDHHYPLSKHNPLTLNNAVVLCRFCNSSKGAKDPKEFYTKDQLIKLANKFKELDKDL